MAETFSYYDFPVEHWKRIRTNNGLERIMKEIRRRTRAIGAFPDGKSALMLVADQATTQINLDRKEVSQYGTINQLYRGG